MITGIRIYVDSYDETDNDVSISTTTSTGDIVCKVGGPRCSKFRKIKLNFYIPLVYIFGLGPVVSKHVNLVPWYAPVARVHPRTNDKR